VTQAAALTLDRLIKHFAGQIAVDEVSLEVRPGELIVLLGPSGCGKTTTLRMIAGFIPVSGGDIRLDGVSIAGLPPYRRDMGIVFQSYALFPHLSVARNIAFGLEMRHVDRAAIEARVAAMLRLVKLDAFADRLPRQLSGGQQQRVALARALAIHPKLLLLDEPLSNLDAGLRQDMAREIRLLQQRGGITTIMVTHDQHEAMALGDRLVVMRDGRVQQIGTPEDLHLRPANSFVARFIGGSNILSGELDGGAHLRLPGGETTISLAGNYRRVVNATLAIRPDSIRLAPPGTPSARVIGEVELSTYLGTTVEHVVRIGADATMLTRGPGIGPDSAPRLPVGSKVALCWTADEERLFDTGDRAVPAEPAVSVVQRETDHV
jgi:putative spermidine/putrescine transport system ATP-binding protein